MKEVGVALGSQADCCDRARGQRRDGCRDRRDRGSHRRAAAPEPVRHWDSNQLQPATGVSGQRADHSGGLQRYADLRDDYGS